MKVCIFGSGATGGYMGVELARAGAEVSLVARGAHLQAIRENGLEGSPIPGAFNKQHSPINAPRFTSSIMRCDEASPG